MECEIAFTWPELVRGTHQCRPGAPVVEPGLMTHESHGTTAKGDAW